MFDLLFITSIIGTCVNAFKEANTPVIPAENWGNRELMYKDRMSGVSEKQIMENLSNGKYRKEIKTYQEPHRDTDGKIIIENCKLYNEDLFKYGAVQTMKWVKQGKYNLNKEELKKEEERIKKHFEKLYSI